MSWLTQERTTAAEQLQFILDAARVERAIYAIAALGIPDLLADGAATSEQLAAATRTREDLLTRVLRFLTAAGVTAEGESQQFSLTEIGQCLCAAAPGSRRPTVLHRGAPWVTQPWDGLAAMLRSGRTAFDEALGSPLFTYLASNADAQQIFDASMTGITRLMKGIIPKHYDFSFAKLIVDIGGGEGELVADILAHYPAAHGLVFDQPHVAERCRARLTAAGLGDRCQALGGDFFDGVPPGGDVYLMKMILHDWDDDRSRTILQSCRTAMHQGSRLLLVERVLPAEPPYPLEPFMIDVMMMVLLGSQERTEQEWSALLSTAGFELLRVISTGTPMHVIEAQLAK